MARIRTVKPEFFISESCAEVSVHAERTFLGLLTQADDHGRFRDNPAIIAGLLWPLRVDHTPVHVEDDLQQLGEAHLICRYTGCDGRHYLHVVTWFEHQKIDKPSQSRLPACPDHHAEARCGACKGTCAVFAESSADVRRGLDEGSASPSREPARPPKDSSLRPDSAGEEPAALDGATDSPNHITGKDAGRKGGGQTSPKAPRSLSEGSAPGSRILDPGSTDPSGRTAPAPTVSAQDLVREYVAACKERPPGDVIGHLGRITKKLLDEGIAPEHIRSGLRRFAATPKHPSVLTSMVNEAMNAGPSGLVRTETRPNVPAHRAWSNPVNPATAYAEEL
ncbi:hypothetical protein [Streptomyces sp. Ru87]|uniref:hypothetical protein n=1 Tax=Streptomyces sp. Ru87 TaxID=2044307 RepID=UPI000BF90651|nr:hypothetical protein [Streptomyces sp. Ru87]PGH49699.1 hypothetical protein CRI70_16215 [Streptomyces sp. Ru87]